MSEIAAMQELHHDLIQEVMAAAEANSDFREAEFTALITNELSEAGIIEGFTACHYRAAAGGVRVDGYWFSETALDLFITDFAQRETLESLTQTEIGQIFKRAENFFTQSADRGLAASLEDTSPPHDLAYQIQEQRGEITKVNLYILSERVLSDRVQTLDDKTVGDRTVSYNVWDISRLYRLRSSTGAREELVINFQEMMGGLACLPAHLDSASYRSYLAVMPASVLADLYEKYGSRLLEQNVRSFLQVRGSVNKGIRATILNDSDMFFAYNNGITATAREVETLERSNGTFITCLTDLQIVNGGQTTASLFNARRNDKASLDSIFVQMKLSVVDEALSEEIVPRISEYANTQNKVNAADFFSNHPFHIRMQEMSRRLWVPAQQGSQRETKWFYERARGQYADGQNKRTLPDKRRFLAEYPKLQMFTKTDLAKFENVWSESFMWVHMGAQKNFGQYARRIGEDWAKSNTQFNDHYYKQAIARGIIFRRTEQLVTRQNWYSGGYRANTVAYSISLLAEICNQRRQRFDFNQVWSKQSLSEATDRALVMAARIVYREITQPRGRITNVTEWCKREGCWNQLKECLNELIQDLSDTSFFDELLDMEDIQNQVRSAAKTRRVQTGIEAQVKVTSIPGDTWADILSQGKRLNLFSLKEVEVLQIAAQYPVKIPTDRQSLLLLDILDKAVQEAIYAD